MERPFSRYCASRQMEVHAFYAELGRRSPLPSEINSDVPTKLDPIFDKMTQDRKESRYPDFEAVFEDFYSAFADKTYLTRGDLIMWSELTPQ